VNNKILLISASLLAIAALTVWTIIQSEQSDPPSNPSVNGRATLEIRGAPTKGPLDAKVTIVEFFDPACETCAIFYPLVNDLIQQYPGKVNVMMRYAPFHKGSEQVVKLLAAAHLQGQFWPAVEILFTNQQSWTRHHVADPGRAVALLTSLPLDHEQFVRDVNSDNITNIIQQDIADGKMLKVRATPQFFVNGKPLVEFGHKPLLELVQEAIDQNY
jgi:protein-disulfide isomerase